MEQEKPQKTKEIPSTRSFRDYFLFGIWLALVIFFVQNAWASVYENEVRAAMIYAGFSLLLFFGGIAFHYSRKLDY